MAGKSESELIEGRGSQQGHQLKEGPGSREALATDLSRKPEGLTKSSVKRWLTPSVLIPV